MIYRQTLPYVAAHNLAETAKIERDSAERKLEKVNKPKGKRAKKASPKNSKA